MYFLEYTLVEVMLYRLGEFSRIKKGWLAETADIRPKSFDIKSHPDRRYSVEVFLGLLFFFGFW